jgi:RNA polymerase sigma-32 factor
MALNLKMLSAAEERELILRWQEHGDERAMHKVVEAHIPLAMKMANQFKGYKLPIEDLTQEAVSGLIETMRTFDVSKGLRFNTLARWYIRSAMQDYVLSQFSVVRHATTAKAKREFFKGNRIAHASLDVQVTSDGMTRADMLIDDGPNPYEIVEAVIDEEREKERVRKSLKKLPPRSRDIIRRRFLNKNVETLDSIANRYGISRERVRQIEQRSLTMLKVDLA